MKTVTKGTIEEYANLSGRKNSFDDNTEMGVFCRFLQNARPDLTVVPKPYGKKGVDVAYKDGDEYTCFFDLERCGTWKEDWPFNWRCLSFLDRKSRYLKYPQFGMVWFSDDLSRFVIAWKKDIIKYPVSKRYLRNGQVDEVREVDYSCGILHGSSFGKKEIEIFSNRKEMKL